MEVKTHEKINTCTIIPRPWGLFKLRFCSQQGHLNGFYLIFFNIFHKQLGGDSGFVSVSLCFLKAKGKAICIYLRWGRGSESELPGLRSEIRMSFLFSFYLFNLCFHK